MCICWIVIYPADSIITFKSAQACKICNRFLHVYVCCSAAYCEHIQSEINQGIMNAVKLSAPLGSIGIIYPTNKEAKKPKPCIHCDKIPQVFEKTRNVKKKTSGGSCFLHFNRALKCPSCYITVNTRLWFLYLLSNTRLRLLHLLYDIEVMWRKTIKYAFLCFI